jgi:hypothetical protein
MIRWYLLRNDGTGWFLYRREGGTRLGTPPRSTTNGRSWFEDALPEYVKETISVLDIATTCDLGYKSGQLYMVSDEVAGKILELP